MALERLHLELLQALADHSTLRSAAASINLSPSAASRRLDEAERRVGVTLTRTDGRSLELTPAGRYLAEAARAAARTLDDAEIAARWLDRGAAQPVRVGLGFHDTITWALDPTTPFEVLRTTETSWASSIERGAVEGRLVR